MTPRFLATVYTCCMFESIADSSMQAVLALQDEPSGAYLFWGFVLFGVAVVIVALELVIPSAGMLAMLAGAAMVASVVSFFMYDSTAGFLSILIYLVLTPIVVVFGFRWWMNSPLGKHFVLRNAVDNDLPMDDESGPRYENTSAKEAAEMRELIGAEGETVTPCRPVGLVKIDGVRIEALAETGTIDAATPVVVTDVYDNQVKIRPR